MSLSIWTFCLPLPIAGVMVTHAVIIGLFLPRFLYMFVHICMCGHVYRSNSMCVCARGGPKLMSGLFVLFIKAGSLNQTRASRRGLFCSSVCFGDPLSLSSEAGITGGQLAQHVFGF